MDLCAGFTFEGVTIKPEDFSNEKDVSVTSLEGGYYVKTDHTGPYKFLKESWAKIMEWSKLTGYKLDDIAKGNNLEVYVNDPGQVKEEEYKTDLYCKLAPNTRPNTICHIDLSFDDAKRCQNFYEKSFGWKFMPWKDEYFLFTTPEAFHTLQGGFTKKK